MNTPIFCTEVENNHFRKTGVNRALADPVKPTSMGQPRPFLAEMDQKPRSRNRAIEPQIPGLPARTKPLRENKVGDTPLRTVFAVCSLLDTALLQHSIERVTAVCGRYQTDPFHASPGGLRDNVDQLSQPRPRSLPLPEALALELALEVQEEQRRRRRICVLLVSHPEAPQLNPLTSRQLRRRPPKRLHSAPPPRIFPPFPAFRNETKYPAQQPIQLSFQQTASIE